MVGQNKHHTPTLQRKLGRYLVSWGSVEDITRPHMQAAAEVSHSSYSDSNHGRREISLSPRPQTNPSVNHNHYICNTVLCPDYMHLPSKKLSNSLLPLLYCSESTHVVNFVHLYPSIIMFLWAGISQNDFAPLPSRYNQSTHTLPHFPFLMRGWGTRL